MENSNVSCNELFVVYNPLDDVIELLFDSLACAIDWVKSSGLPDLYIYHYRYVQSYHLEKLADDCDDCKDNSDWKPFSFDEACEIVRSKPISSDMSYEERLSVIKSRFGL